MNRGKIYRGKPALDLLEEAAHLLRQTPLRLLLAYYAGAVPFALGLLHFWTDMSTGALAWRHCASSALGMTGLFLWMKFWQVIFVTGLRDSITGHAPEKWTSRRVLRVLAAQAILQPSKLFVLPVALVITLPFPWVLAFYENVTVLGNGEDALVSSVARRAAGLARIWPAQNHALFGILFLLGLAVWANAVIAVAFAPQLLKMLLGVETAFTRGGSASIVNTTFLAVTFTLAYLALDPLVKTIYVLRCFYGEARRDGADLLAELAGVMNSGRVLAAALVLTLGLISLPAFGGERAVTTLPAKDETAAHISPTDLDAAVKATLAQDRYAWRLPREKAPESDSPAVEWFRQLLKGMADTVLNWARNARDLGRKIYDWFHKIFRTDPDRSSENGSSTDWIGILRGFAYILLALAAVALGLLVWRIWRQGRRKDSVVVAEVLPAKPDLQDENVMASQLPEHGWLELAQELMEKGERRLAVRALYLASLAHLAQREVISLARFKSNRDYEGEVARRARGQADLRAAFSENVAVFDLVWYGLHEVTTEALQLYRGNLERIRAA